MVYTNTHGIVLKDKNKLAMFLVAIGFALMTTIGMFIPARADSTVVVSGDTAAGENQEGWMFNRDVLTSTPFEFTTDEASLGDGSIYVEPIGVNPSDKFIAEYFYLDEVANVESISYDFMTDNASDVDQFYMNLYVNDGSDATEFYDCRYNVVPTLHDPDPVTGFTTFTYNLADAATSVTASSGASIACSAAPADLPAGAVLRAISINVGDTGAGDAGLDGYLDAVVLNETDETTTFDFEPEAELLHSVNGGGHILDGEGKRKTWNDISFGLNVENYNVGTEGNVVVRFHNVAGDDVDKTTFHSSEITDFNFFDGNNNCEAAVNFTAVGTWNGDDAELIFRAGDNEDTARVTLSDSDGVVYDSFASGDFPPSDNCVGTARTHLDNGNIGINEF